MDSCETKNIVIYLIYEKKGTYYIRGTTNEILSKAEKDLYPK